MKQFRLFFALIISLMVGADNAWAAVGSTFTANTTEGVAVTYRVLTESGSTGTVQVGNDAVAISKTTTGAVTIPSEVTNEGITYSVTIIGECAFKDCSSITNIIVPSSVVEIQDVAIVGCSALERVTMLSQDPPFIYNNSTFYSFHNNNRDCLLIVPEGSRLAYASWAINFFNIKEVGHENILEVGDVAIHPLVATNINTGEAIEDSYYAYVTYIDLTPGQRKAIINRPYCLYSPTDDFDQNPCWDDQWQNANVAIYFRDSTDNSACRLLIPSSVTDSEGNEYTVVGIGANAANSSINIGNIRDIRIPKTITHIGRKAFFGMKGLTGNVVLPSSVRQLGAPSNTSFAYLFCNYCSGSNYEGWVKGLFIMHSNADDFHWYDGAYTGVISSGAGYFYYNNNTNYKSKLYISQDIRNTYEGTSGNGVYAWKDGNAYHHHIFRTFDPALVAGITRDYVEQYSTGTYQLYVENFLDLPLTTDNFTSSDPSKVRIVSLTESVSGNGYNYLTYEVLDEGSATISFSYPGDDVLDPLSSSVTITYPEIFTETVDGQELTFRVLTEGNEGNTVQLGAARYDYIALDDDDAPIFFDKYGEYEQFTVPETVEHDGKTYTVTAIGGYAFANFPGESVELPATIEAIGFRAFNYDDYNPYNVYNLYINSQVPPTLIIDNNNSVYTPFNYQFSNNCILHVPEGCKAAYNNSPWSDYFKKIIEPVDAIVIKGVPYTSESTDLFGDGTASLTWEPEESSGGSIPIAYAPRKAREKSGTENLVPVLTLENATINYEGNGPAIEVNSNQYFYIRVKGQNTITATNANAAISIGTAKGEDFDECALIILNDDETGGSDELASLTVANSTTGGDGIYISCGSFNVQNCAVDATGANYGLHFNESNGGGSNIAYAPRRQAEENAGPRKVVAPDGPVNPEWYAGYLNVFEGSELTLHGNEAAVWGASNRNFENVGVVESDLNAYMSQYKYYEMPGFRGYHPYYEGEYDYESYEIWVSNDNNNWQPKYAKMLTIAPNTLYANTNEGVQMKFTIVSESAKTVRVGDENGGQAIDEYYNGPITIPETVDGYSVVGIATGAFTGCRLTSIELPETEAFSWISNSAFAYSSLQSIYIPENVTKIGRAAFESCYSLTDAYLYAATGLKSLPAAMFYNCNYLKFVVLPSSVNSIGYNAFTYCYNLDEVYCLAVVPPSWEYIYIDSNYGPTLYVPYGCYNKYIKSDWSYYFYIQMMAAEDADLVTIEPEDEYVVTFGEDLIMDDGQGNTEALPLENAVAGGVYYNLVSNGEEFNGIDVNEGCIVISSTTSEDDMNDVVESELQSETMQNNFCGLIVEVNGKGTLKINCMTVGSGVLTVRIGNGAPIPYTSQDGTTPIAIPFDVTEPTLIYIYASDSEASSGVKGYHLMSRRRAGESNEISGVMIYQMSVEEHVPVYNIEIGGTMVNGENASDFTYPGLNYGTISFDPETYTLTLENVDMEGNIVINGDSGEADEDVQHLTINLIGYNVMKTFECPFYVWESYDEEHILESLPPFVELTFTSPDGEGMLQTLVVDEDNTNWDANEDGVWDDPVYAWKLGGLWSLMGVKDLTIDHCQVIGGMIDAESIIVQNGALLATSYQIEGSVTCGEGISYRGYLEDIYVYGPNELIITEPINISQYGLATYCSPNNDLNFTEVEDVKAYIATGFNSATNQLTLTRVYNVPAGTGLLLYSASGETVEDMQIPAESTTNTYENNMFVGCVEDTYIWPTYGEYTNFVLSKHSEDDYLGFYTFTTSNPQGRLIEAGKAYLQIPTDQLNIGGGIKGFSLVFDDDPTGIVEIEGGNSKILEDTEIYNLAGQRLNKVQKGINIVNGKKIAVK